MINFDDLNKADQNIDDLIKLRDQLINASSYINSIKSNLTWLKKVCTEIPEQSDKILSLAEVPVQNTMLINPSNLDFSFVTGATGSYHAYSADTREIIRSYGSLHYNLITEYDELYKTEDLIDEIIEKMKEYREPLIEFEPAAVLHEAKEAYSKWKAGAIDNADLSASIRAFQDIFNGLLKRAWVDHLFGPDSKKSPDFSWPKISEALGKNGGGCKMILRKMQGTEDKLHELFTEVLKKTKEISKEEMDTCFKDYIEHVYAIINLVDESIMK